MYHRGIHNLCNTGSSQEGLESRQAKYKMMLNEDWMREKMLPTFELLWCACEWTWSPQQMAPIWFLWVDLKSICSKNNFSVRRHSGPITLIPDICLFNQSFPHLSVSSACFRSSMLISPLLASSPPPPPRALFFSSAFSHVATSPSLQ